MLAHLRVVNRKPHLLSHVYRCLPANLAWFESYLQVRTRFVRFRNRKEFSGGSVLHDPPGQMPCTGRVLARLTLFSYPAGYFILTYIGCSLSVIRTVLMLLTYSLFVYQRARVPPMCTYSWRGRGEEERKRRGGRGREGRMHGKGGGAEEGEDEGGRKEEAMRESTRVQCCSSRRGSL